MVLINFYKIISANTNMVYVGSTKKTLEERLQKHDRDYKYFQEGKQRYITSFEILEFKNYSIELIETKLCETKTDRDTRECWHIINTANTVNKCLPGRTMTQYHQEHEEEIHRYQQQYQQVNREHTNQKHNCNCGGKYTTAHKATHEKTKKHQNFINRPVYNINANIVNIYNAPHPQ